jgi:hypothetical protein
MKSAIYSKRIPSPFQPKKEFNVREMNHAVHPVREEINRVIGTYNLTAIIREDTQTLTAMKHVGGMIAFICSLSRDGKIIAEGRGATVIGPNNKWLTRAVESAFNSALSDAVIRSTKVLGTFLATSGSAISLEEAYREVEAQKNAEPATDKQISYLRQLIQSNIEDDHERDQWESLLTDMSKREACAAIEQFVN